MQSLISKQIDSNKSNKAFILVRKRALQNKLEPTFMQTYNYILKFMRSLHAVYIRSLYAKFHAFCTSAELS